MERILGVVAEICVSNVIGHFRGGAGSVGAACRTIYPVSLAFSHAVAAFVCGSSLIYAPDGSVSDILFHVLVTDARKKDGKIVPANL